MNDEILDLDPEQKKAWNRFVKAHKDLKRLKVVLVNNYGSIEAYNSKYVQGYNDVEGPTGTCLPTNEGFSAAQSFYDGTLGSWADDSHFIHLTEKGQKLLNDEG